MMQAAQMKARLFISCRVMGVGWLWMVHCIRFLFSFVGNDHVGICVPILPLQGNVQGLKREGIKAHEGQWYWGEYH